MFNQRSIKGKLTLLTASACTIALTLSIIAFAIIDLRIMRRAEVKQLNAVAQLVGTNSTAAIAFNETEAAEELLQGLNAHRSVVAAGLYNEDGEVVASFSRNGKFDPPKLQQLGSKFMDTGFLEIRRPIVEDGERVGTVFIRAAMHDLDAAVRRYISVAFMILLVALGAAILASRPIQEYIARPVRELASTAQKISENGDYSVRVEHAYRDEFGVLCDQFNEMLNRVENADRVLRDAHNELEMRVEQRTEDLQLANTKLVGEMGARETAMQKLKEAQDELIQASRKAGMADVANGVLHNVGNVLNSVNVSVSVIEQKVKRLRLSGVSNTAKLMQDQDNLGEFFTNDERGRRLPAYLAKLSGNLADDQREMLGEIDSLTKSVNHIKEIVRAQQSYASMGGVVVDCRPEDLMEDALQFAQQSLERHEIRVERSFESVPNCQLEKGKLLQILINLIKNAKEALLESKVPRMAISLSVGLHEGDVRFQVSDNGIGIPPEKLASIFASGFTTKKTGHGFGLHASANAATEMGGNLNVSSDGPGTGATFTVLVPFKPVNGAAPDQSAEADCEEAATFTTV